MKTVELGDVAEFINGAAFKPSDWEEGGRRIIRIQNLTDSSKPYNRTTKPISQKYDVPKGTLLVSWSASLGVFEWNESDTAVLNQHIFKVVPNRAKVRQDYLRNMLTQALSDMQKFAHGSTMLHVNRGEFLATKIHLPSLDEQKRIAAILDQADALRRLRQRAIDRLNTLSQSIFYEMFGDPSTNPRGWPIVKFADIGKLDRGVSKHRPRNDPALLGGKHPLIQTGDISNANGYIRQYISTYSDAGLRQSKIWKKGTLCITIAANIGKTAILEIDACFPDSVVGFIPNEKTTAEYVQYWLQTIQKRLEDGAPQSAQKNINLAILRGLDIPLPPKESQQKFCSVIRGIESRKLMLHNASRKTEALFSALQHRAFAGKL